MIISYSLLFASISLLWLNKKLALIIFCLAFTSAFLSNILSFQALIVSILFFICLTINVNRNLKIFLNIIASFLALAFLLHKMPGFNNVLIYNQIKLSPLSAPYNMFLNFDKALIGFSLLYTNTHLINSSREIRNLIIKNYKIILFSSISIILLSQALGFVKFDIKFPHQIYLWSINNLLIVCIAEETIFRGVIQKNLNKFFNGKFSIILTSILFALAHYPGGINYMLLVFGAGLLYSYVYFQSKRIELSILAHFFVNLIHFLFFSYPSL